MSARTSTTRQTRDAPLCDIARSGEAARRILDRAGLDYCCDGEKTLRVACASAGLDIERVTQELGDRGAAPGSSWAQRGVTELLDHILKVVHPRTRCLLEELLAARAGLPQSGPHARELLDAIDHLAQKAELQMSEEERVLFVRARALAEARKGRGPFPTAFSTLHDAQPRLRAGHAAMHAQLRRLQTLAAHAPGEAGSELRECLEGLAEAMKEQIHLENNELFPRALDLEPGGQEAR